MYCSCFVLMWKLANSYFLFRARQHSNLFSLSAFIHMMTLLRAQSQNRISAISQTYNIYKLWQNQYQHKLYVWVLIQLVGICRIKISHWFRFVIYFKCWCDLNLAFWYLTIFYPSVFSLFVIQLALNREHSDIFTEPSKLILLNGVT